jgi:hypothetical protein
MDNVQNCGSYINIPSSQIYRSYLHVICFPSAVTKALCFRNIKRACYESGGVFHMFVRNKIAIAVERLRESNGI